MSKLNLYAITGSLTDDIDPVTIIISADDQIAAENAFESELRVIRELDDEVDIFGAFRVADIAPDGSLVLAESLKPILPASEAGDLRLFSVTLDDEPLPTSRLVCLHDEAGLYGQDGWARTSGLPHPRRGVYQLTYILYFTPSCGLEGQIRTDVIPDPKSGAITI